MYNHDTELERHLNAKRANYKAMHDGTARHKKVWHEFRAAGTLTEMRKILWGEKKKMKKRSKG